MDWRRKERIVHSVVSGMGCIVIMWPGCVFAHIYLILGSYFMKKISWAAKKELFIFLPV